MVRLVLAFAVLAFTSETTPALPTRAPSPLETRAIYCLAALTAERQDLDSALADKLEDDARRALQQSRTDVVALQETFSAYLTPLSGVLDPAAVSQVARTAAGDEAGTAEGNAKVSKCDPSKSDFQACLAAGLGPVLGRLRACHDPAWLPTSALHPATPSA